MVEALRIRTLISGKTLTISDLDRFVGKRIEVIVLEDDQTESERLAAVRRFGSLAGKLEVADDLDAPLPSDVEQAFEGERDA